MTVGNYLHNRIMRCFIVALFVGLFTGCSATREETAHEVRQDRATTRTTTEATKTVPGVDGLVVAEVITTVTTTEVLATGETKRDASAVTTLPMPPLVATAAQILPKVASIAAGGGIPWELIIGGGSTLIAGALAAHQRAKAAASNQRADEHKADAAEGWKLAQENALKVPPQPPVKI